MTSLLMALCVADSLSEPPDALQRIVDVISDPEQRSRWLLRDVRMRTWDETMQNNARRYGITINAIRIASRRLPIAEATCSIGLYPSASTANTHFAAPYSAALNLWTDSNRGNGPIADGVWRAPPTESYHFRILSTSYIVRESEVIVNLRVQNRPVDPKAFDAKFPQFREGDIDYVEHAASELVSAARIGIMDFLEIPIGKTTIAGKSVSVRVLRNRRSMVRADELLRASATNVEFKLGVLSAKKDGLDLIVPSSAKQVMRGNRKIGCAEMILIYKDQVWVDKDAMIALIAG